MDYFLETYAGKCFKLKKAHEMSVMHYTQKNNFINFANISVVTFIAISNNITAVFKNPSSVVGVAYSIGLYFSVLISSLQKFLQYEKLTERHRIASVRYNNLYNAILLDIVMRENASKNKQEFVKWVSQEYDTLYNETPNVPKELLVKSEEIDVDVLFEKIKEEGKNLENNIKKHMVQKEPNPAPDAPEIKTKEESDYDKAMLYQMMRMVSSYNE